MSVAVELRFPHGAKDDLVEEVTHKTVVAVSLFATRVSVTSSVNRDLTMVHCRLTNSLQYRESLDRIADDIFEGTLRARKIPLMLEDPQFGKFLRGREHLET